MIRKSTILLILLTASAIAFAAGGRPTKPPEKPRKRNGDYRVLVAGYFKGNASATVSTDTLYISGEVTDPDGTKGALKLTAAIKGDHFSGNGTALGLGLTIKGRIDAPDLDKEDALKLSRIVGTLTTNTGKYSKIVGDLPGSGKPASPPGKPGVTPGGGSGSDALKPPRGPAAPKGSAVRPPGVTPKRETDDGPRTPLRRQQQQG